MLLIPNLLSANVTPKVGRKNINLYFITGKIAFRVASVPHAWTSKGIMNNKTPKKNKINTAVDETEGRSQESTVVLEYGLEFDTQIHKHPSSTKKYTHTLYTDIPLLIAAIIKGFIWISKTWTSSLGDT